MTTERSFDDESRQELDALQATLDAQDIQVDVYAMAEAFMDKKARQVGEPHWWFGKRYIWVRNEAGNLCSERF